MSLSSKTRLGPGQRVLVNGAAGGIGMFVTQLAVQAGAEVTAVASAANLGLLLRWGVARAVDYRQTDILSEGQRYDVIVDMSDRLTLSLVRPILTPRGLFVATLPQPMQILGGLLNNLVSPQRYAVLGRFPNTRSLTALASEVAANHLDVVVGGSFALPDFATAYAQTVARKLPGKTVITMDPP